MIAIKNLKENQWLAIILFIGAILSFYKLDFQSPWLDEIHTLNEANPQLTFSEVYTSLMTSEQMPPFYFYCIYFLFKFFGYSIFVARLLSAITGLLSLYAIYLLGKELINERVGLIASALLSLNIFNLYYSQEARPYELLMLFTILVFYRLIKLIRTPNTINAIYYGLSAGLLLLTHFFGLFIILAHAIIGLLYLVTVDKKSRIKVVLKFVISAVIAIGLFIPAIKIFIKVSEIKEFWIPPTTIDTIKQIFKDFCGNSDFIQILGIVAIGYFLFLLFKKKYSIENKYFFGGIILFLWVVLVLAVPIIRSYLVVPMIISRYFITILPALILMVAMALDAFKFQKISLVFLVVFLIGSSYEIIFHSNYYTRISKEQFREGTNFIKANNRNQEPIVSSLGWYLPYFFKEDFGNYHVVDKPLEIYLADMQKDTTKIEAFWYFDAFGRQYNPNEELHKFIDNHFFIENNFEGFQAWTKHFVPKNKLQTTVDISEFLPLKANNGYSIRSWVDRYSDSQNKVDLFGWAYLEGQDDTNSKTTIVLISGNSAQRIFQFEKVLRTDITDSVNKKFNLDNTGFKATIDKTTLSKGSYEVGILIEDFVNKRRGLVLTGKKFSV
ncbi:glycosyltransferase family 39 protein [Flavobacterium sp. N1994]|uniref:glycosyltransferase family 39 protein n=1 Tax=Flavobacterium sp. N1994 TaxID=2986827 RepID=UPI002223D51C|nr:glycosyltransferase family 39 protein [Flavobacterium sp. N1994]